MGHIYLGELNEQSASYTAGYVTKKLTKHDDPWLNGRYPEFSRMSRKPGLAFDFVEEIASTFLQHNLEKSEIDVPTTLRRSNKTMPLGRYLTRRLRTLVGRDVKTPQQKLDEIQAEVQLVRETTWNTVQTVKQAMVEAGDQKVLNAETKQKIFGQRKHKL